MQLFGSCRVVARPADSAVGSGYSDSIAGNRSAPDHSCVCIWMQVNRVVLAGASDHHRAAVRAQLLVFVMKQSLTRSMSFLHTWAGLLFGWLLFGIFLTGSISVFWREISHWATPELHAQPLVSREFALQKSFEILHEEAGNARMWQITLPSERERALQVSWESEGDDRARIEIEPITGQELTETQGGRHFNRFHHRLGLDGDWNQTGRWITGILALAMLVIMVSGVLIHKHIFRDLLVFRPKGNSLLAWADLHRLTGVISLPFTLLIVLSSFGVNYWIYYPAAISTLYDGDAQEYRADVGQGRARQSGVQHETPPGTISSNLPVSRILSIAAEAMGTQGVSQITFHDPGRASATVEVRSRRDDRIAQQVDRVTINAVTGEVLELVNKRPAMFATQSTLVGLHYALFGGMPMRWIYLTCGLIGTAVIGTGLVLFAKKRTARSPRLAVFTARANAGTIMGPLVASIAYLWGLRLVPAGLTDRPTAEITVFYGVFALVIIYAAMRSSRHSWRELTALFAALSITLPLSSALTERGGLASTLQAGDYATAGVDLAALASGLMALGVTVWFNRRALRKAKAAV